MGTTNDGFQQRINTKAWGIFRELMIETCTYAKEEEEHVKST